MITDARVLEEEFVPDEIEHRNAEINALSNTLRPIMDGQPGETSLLLGPAGAGKSCTARYTIDQLRENVLDITTQYVNCWQDYARFKVLYRLLEPIGETATIHRRSTPKDELLDRLTEYDGPPYVVILDEADQLEDKRVLYDLYQLPRITMVLIANRERDLFSLLDDRLTSRLQTCVRINFEKYPLDDLVSILEARARWGLSEDAIGRPHLAQIADAAAGDARIAISILRNAAKQAEQHGSDRISAECIHDAIPEGRAEVQEKTIDQLPPHQRALYDILYDEGEIDMGTLYEQYSDRVDEPMTRRTIRTYLAKLEQYKLIHAEGDKRGRTYRLR